MRTWTIVVVAGRPSPRVSEFFNSIKFHTYHKESPNHEMAILDFAVPEEILTEGYEVLNWYAFEDKEKAA